MRATFLAATAAFAVSALAYPHAHTKQANVTEQWGSWIVSNLSSSYPPSGSHKSLDFLIQYESQADSVHCSAYFPGTAQGIGPNQSYTPCDDEAVSFTSDLSIGNIWIFQKLYQRSAIVLLKGNASLSLYGGNCTTNAVGGGTCSGAPFKVPVTSVSYQLANGTIIDGNNTSSAGDDTHGDYAEEDNDKHGQGYDDDGDYDNSTDDSSDSGTATYTEDTYVQEESTDSGDDEPYDGQYHLHKFFILTPE
ncbi:uncharacterized protein LTHEOB_2258 [Lasiodiplodia theobromae]|uniref:uncharacterized protein n=1 Tax=Lasiodiplodia theobromae TaxID=45133 RepID=UPI0015C34E55|nr:uncharacterized protein LTHEOB_2258 [Lasiodiplodia theobromae]KAF4535266.1 hypothetical protein LTHEOB_2258 [Lasiodiplodia theobromae]